MPRVEQHRAAAPAGGAEDAEERSGERGHGDQQDRHGRARARCRRGASGSQPKGQANSILEVVGVERRLQPGLRALVQLAVGEHLGDRVVDRLSSGVLVLVEADMRRRGQELELLLRLQRVLPGEHLGADIVADHHQLGLAGDEGLDHRIVVVEALDVGVGGCGLGQRGVFQRAAVDGDRLVGEVFLAFDRSAAGPITAM